MQKECWEHNNLPCSRGMLDSLELVLMISSPPSYSSGFDSGMTNANFLLLCLETLCLCANCNDRLCCISET